jgi:hypothetical protein
MYYSVPHRIVESELRWHAVNFFWPVILLHSRSLSIQFVQGREKNAKQSFEESFCFLYLEDFRSLLTRRTIAHADDVDTRSAHTHAPLCLDFWVCIFGFFFATRFFF